MYSRTARVFLFALTVGAFNLFAFDRSCNVFVDDRVIASEEPKITVERTYDNSASSWETAMLDAEKYLIENSTKTIGDLPSCLLPDKKRTAKLVRDAVALQRKFAPSAFNPNHTTGSISHLPLPVINMGMPKCGSSTLFEFFNCTGFAATHWNINTDDFEGLCMRDAHRAGLPILATCASEKDALMQIDIAMPFGWNFDGKPKSMHTKLNRDDCFFPQLSLLEEIHNEAPNATFILNFRPIEDWIKSITGWGDMMPRFQSCDLPNLPRGHPVNLEDSRNVHETMIRFFCSHVLHLRRFVESYPSHALIELDLYDTTTSKAVMSALFPSSSGKSPPSACWKHKNKSNNEKQTKKTK